MKRVLYALVASVALLGAQNVAPVEAPMPPSEHPPQLASVDDAFAIAATEGGTAEIAAARLALDRSEADEVKAFARQMIVDHTAIEAEGKPLVKAHLAHPPAPLAPPSVLAMDYLRSVPPVDFDQNYAVGQIGDHVTTMTVFATEARDGKDPGLKAFAKKWLPTIQAHLELAISLAKHVGGDTPFRR